MLVTAIEARPLRSLERVEVELGPGITSVVGANGAGKTNLLEALYFALTGRSFRTSDRRELIPFGEPLARAEATILDDGRHERRLPGLGQPRGGPPPPARRQPRSSPTRDSHCVHRSRSSPPTGWRSSRARRPSAGPTSTASSPPAGRSRAACGKRYGQALAQRNALLAPGRRRAGAARGPRLLGRSAGRRRRAADRGSRRRRSPSSAPRFADAAAELGLGESRDARVRAPCARRRGRPARRARRAPRRPTCALGRTHLGPAPGRAADLARPGGSLRRYGSQGQQRLALLALLFAEREALVASRRLGAADAARRRDERARPAPLRAARRSPRRRRPGADHRHRGGLAAPARPGRPDRGCRLRQPPRPRLRHEPPARPATGRARRSVPPASAPRPRPCWPPCRTPGPGRSASGCGGQRPGRRARRGRRRQLRRAPSGRRSST